MALESPTEDTDHLYRALDSLTHLGPDEYIVAFGPDGQQFCGSPNGYAGTRLPSFLLQLVASGLINKVTWASFGSDSYFLIFERKDGTCFSYKGGSVPKLLRENLTGLRDTDQDSSPTRRVQLGDNGSFVTWDQSEWACSNVPTQLQERLCQLSYAVQENDNFARGLLSSPPITNVTWHRNGSWYLHCGDIHIWNYETPTMQQAWDSLWPHRNGALRPCDLAQLAYVAIDPHATDGNTFVFIKKQNQVKGDCSFTMHFPQEPTISRLESDYSETSRQRTSSTSTNYSMDSDGDKGSTVTDTERPVAAISSDTRLQTVSVEEDPVSAYGWAKSKKTGRPNPRDTRELLLRKGETVKVLKDKGRNWYIVETKKGRGWAHGSWLDIEDQRKRAEVQDAYIRFRRELELQLVPGQLRSFPRIDGYMNVCKLDGCKMVKEEEESLGVCIHDLRALLEGSDCFSLEWLKEERVMWHPDRFARYCHPDQREELKRKAELVFVMYGVLIDMAKSG